MKVQLRKLAYSRSGDKGDMVNIGLIASEPRYYSVLAKFVTDELVKKHFTGICNGEVLRCELPKIGALNFMLHKSLGGGGTASLRTDPQGKTLSTALLRMEIDVDEETAKKYGLV